MTVEVRAKSGGFTLAISRKYEKVYRYRNSKIYTAQKFHQKDGKVQNRKKTERENVLF